jgi:hypothetical protein
MYKIHKKNCEINIEKEDVLHAEESLLKAMGKIEEGDDFKKAKNLR